MAVDTRSVQQLGRDDQYPIFVSDADEDGKRDAFWRGRRIAQLSEKGEDWSVALKNPAPKTKGRCMNIQDWHNLRQDRVPRGIEVTITTDSSPGS